MNILVRGTKGSNTQDYADRILSALFTTTLTHFGKKTLIIQTDTNHPVEKVLLGKNMAGPVSKNEFNFNNNGMDAIWKSIRSGEMNADDWSDCCHNISRQRKNGLDIADVSSNPEFTKQLLSEFSTFESIIKSASRWYDVIYIFADGNNEELIEKLTTSIIDGANLIDKEVVCVPQSPEKKEEPDTNKFFAVKNFDFASKFTVKEMAKNYGKNVFPVPYNIGFKDACLEENALHFYSTNMKDEENDDNVKFGECICSLVSALLNGAAVVEDKKDNFVFRKRA